MSFSAIPVLDLSRSQHPDTKPAFLLDLRRALLDVGFLYISNTGIGRSLIDDVIKNGKAFFDLPEEAKLAIQMKNAPSFLGYSKLGNEITAHRTDYREQIDLSTPPPLPSPTAPLYHNLLSPNQWPDPSLLPSFRPTFEAYITAMSHLATRFTSLIALALDLPPTAFDRFFDPDQQHKLKIVKYPDAGALGIPTAEPAGQGVGPHKDSMLTSYLLQASPHRGLQAQNRAGEWIDCPPRPGTLVVAIGQGLEALTRGVCASTTHRVLSPRAGEGPRFSVPFFQGVSYDATFESVEVPEGVREGAVGVRRDGVEFTFEKGRWGHLGEATLWNRCKSHEDVAERWYPEIWRRQRETEGEKAPEEERSKDDERGADDDGTEAENEQGVASVNVLDGGSGVGIKAH
ncbi:hypothetical protein MMC13_002680 [Lambiella insularis]|nr:hypothetical protein [Lambiella insularis]